MTYPTITALLETGSRYQPLTLQQTAEWLQTNAPKQLRKVTLRSDEALGEIWRGVKNGEHYPKDGAVLVDPSTTIRRALGMMDIYRILLDEANPNWPARGSSIIASTRRAYAGSFAYDGAAFCVFPPDTADVGFVGHDDIWSLGVQHVSRVADQLTWSLHRAIETAMRDLDIQPPSESQVSAMATVMGRAQSHTTADEWRRTFANLRALLTKASGDLPLDALADAYLDNGDMPAGGSPTGAGVYANTRREIANWIRDPAYDVAGGLMATLKYGNYQTVQMFKPYDLPSVDSEVWMDAQSLIIRPTALLAVMKLINGEDSTPR